MGRHGTIAGRKKKKKKKRAALFTKYARAITVAAKDGGDPEYNVSLKHAIDRAKSINMPNDNINRAIKKGTGELEGATYEELNFEGYGAGGVAVSSVKSTFDKYGGNLGTPGCVSYMFSRKGSIVIEKTEDIDEDALMEAALEAGMEDMNTYDDSFEIITDPNDFMAVKDALAEAGYEFVEADSENIPATEATPEEEELPNLKNMIDLLEENDDVQKVYHNCAVDLEEV